MAPTSGGAHPADAGEVLAKRLAAMMRETGIPNGLGELGYAETDVPALVKGAYAQQRLLVMAPRPVSEANLADLFRNALWCW